jgi:HEAT repeat protein
MKTARVLKWSGAFLALAALVVLIPGSPVYLPSILNGKGQYEGHSSSYWVRALDSPDAELRRHAIFVLGTMGSEGAEAVPALAAIMVDDPKAEMRLEASLALSKMAPASRAAVPQLAQALADQELYVRHNAALALLALGTEARPAVPALLDAFKDKANKTNLRKFNLTIQETVAVTLGHASAGDGQAVPALLEALKSADRDEMNLCIVRALGEIGAPARPALPQLRPFLRSNRPELQQAAEDAVKKIEASPATG